MDALHCTVGMVGPALPDPSKRTRTHTKRELHVYIDDPRGEDKGLMSLFLHLCTTLSHQRVLESMFMILGMLCI